jgi:hypothetical protein
MCIWKKHEAEPKLAERYFSSIGSIPNRLPEIRKAIIENGKYSEYHEWRISTVTVLTVEPVEVKGKRWYRVSASCDHEFVCHTPTIERAAQFLHVYERLIFDMFYSLGWTSWASKTVLDPKDLPPSDR